MSIKIAYLFLCHKDPEFVQRTAVKLTSGTPNHIFIHVDKKVLLPHLFELLHQSGFLYFRKATSESRELLDYIDEVHKRETAG